MRKQALPRQRPKLPPSARRCRERRCALRSVLLRGAACQLRLARRLGGEGAALDLGAGSVGGDGHSGGGDLRACELETGGYRAAVEQALSLAEHEREGP